MKDISFIIKYGRERIDFWFLFPILIHLFIFSGFIFSLILIAETLFWKYIFIVLSYIFFTLLILFHFKNLLHRITFSSYLNNSKQTLESIIAEIAIEYSLKIKKYNENTYVIRYFLGSKNKFLKKEKKITIIVLHSSALINISFADKTILFNYNDQLSKDFINAFTTRLQCDTSKSNYKIINPFSEYNKN